MKKHVLQVQVSIRQGARVDLVLKDRIRVLEDGGPHAEAASTRQQYIGPCCEHAFRVLPPRHVWLMGTGPTLAQPASPRPLACIHTINLPVQANFHAEQQVLLWRPGLLIESQKQATGAQDEHASVSTLYAGGFSHCGRRGSHLHIL